MKGSLKTSLRIPHESHEVKHSLKQMMVEAKKKDRKLAARLNKKDKNWLKR